jgi:hypothetical protein
MSNVIDLNNHRKTRAVVDMAAYAARRNSMEARKLKMEILVAADQYANGNLHGYMEVLEMIRDMEFEKQEYAYDLPCDTEHSE